MQNKCDCERGVIAFYVSLTTVDGELLDRAGMCRDCLQEKSTKRALEVLNLSAGEPR